MKTFKEYILEAPYVKDGASLSNGYVKKQLIEPIKNALKLGKFEDTGNNIFSTFISHVEVLYVLTKNGKLESFDDIVAAVVMTEIDFYNETFLAVDCTKKFLDEYSRVMLRIYRQASKTFKTDADISIVCDKLQTCDSSNIWKKWYKDPQKYSIKKIRVIDKRVGELIPIPTNPNDVWGSSYDTHTNIRVIAEF